MVVQHYEEQQAVDNCHHRLFASEQSVVDAFPGGSPVVAFSGLGNVWVIVRRAIITVDSTLAVRTFKYSDPLSRFIHASSSSRERRDIVISPLLCWGSLGPEELPNAGDGRM